MAWNIKRIGSGIGTIAIGFIAKWSDRVMNFIGLGGLPDDVATWVGWSVNYGSVILILCGVGLVVYGLVPSKKSLEAAAPTAVLPTSIPFMGLISKAVQTGWDISAENDAIINLLTKFQEGLISGSLLAYGRQASPDLDEGVRQSKPLEAIASEYWQSHEVDPFPVFSGDRNINLCTMAKNNTVTADEIYFDIHLDDEAIAWLELGLGRWIFAKTGDLYVGHISCNIGELEGEKEISYFIRGRNGSKAELHFSDINGHAEYVEVIDGKSVDKGALPTPVYIGETQIIEPGKEFTVQLSQRVPNSLTISVKTAIETGSLQIRFASLDIMLKQERGMLRLPLWNGVTVSAENGKVSTHRLFILKAETGIYKSGFGEQDTNA